jgi:hypothetical protein
MNRQGDNSYKGVEVRKSKINIVGLNGSRPIELGKQKIAFSRA